MRRLLVAAVLALAACEPAPQENIVHDSDLYDLDTRTVPRDLRSFFDCLRERGFTAVSAHRGGPGPGFAENAIPTLENATRRSPGAFLEVDVSQTADGVLVLMHDDRVERTTTGSGAVADLDMAELLQFTLEDERGEAVDARVPTLREALEWAYGRAILELDIKRGVRYEDVIADVEAADAMGRVVFVTYSIDGAARLARLAPQAMIYTTISSARELDTLERRGVDLSRIVAWLGTDAPNSALIEALAARGVEARVGMFGEGRDYANALQAGVEIVAVDDAHEAYGDINAADSLQGVFGVHVCAAG